MRGPRPVTEYVVAQIRSVSSHQHYLRMGGDCVVSLQERLHHDLPIAEHFSTHVGMLILAGKIKLLIVRDHHRSKEFLKGLRIYIGIDEDEAAPGTDLGRSQLLRIFANVGEIPFARDSLQRSVDLPTPAMKAAAEFSCALAATLAKYTASMHTNVQMRLELLLAGPHDDVREVGNIIDVIVTDVWYVVLATGHLPHFFP